PVIAYQNTGLAVWTAYSGHDPEGNMAWFDYRDGSIVVKNPDDEILAKIKQVASHFKANVVGDDGEFYQQAGKGRRSKVQKSKNSQKAVGADRKKSNKKSRGNRS